MKITPFSEKSNSLSVLCLGWFDSVHKGHKSIIETAKKLCLQTGAKLSVLTFVNDKDFLLGKNSNLVYDFNERLVIFKNLGVDEVVYAVFNKQFANKTPLEFLNEICDNRLIAGFVCGNDYSFGKNAMGNVDFLKSYCESKNLILKICEFEKTISGEKISTGSIKQLLINGEIEHANQLLSTNFFVIGKVIKGRMQGRTMGFPTANVLLSENKVKFKRGVYATTVIVDEKSYKAITNVGTAPTFEFGQEVVECHLIDFKGDLYGKTLTVIFNGYIRDIQKFETIEQLKMQLQNDLKVIK